MRSGHLPQAPLIDFQGTAAGLQVGELTTDHRQGVFGVLAQGNPAQAGAHRSDKPGFIQAVSQQYQRYVLAAGGHRAGSTDHVDPLAFGDQYQVNGLAAQQLCQLGQ